MEKKDININQQTDNPHAICGITRGEGADGAVLRIRGGIAFRFKPIAEMFRGIASFVLALSLAASLAPAEAFAAIPLMASTIAQTTDVQSASGEAAGGKGRKSELKYGLAYANLIQSGSSLTSQSLTSGLLSIQSATGLVSIQRTSLRSRLVTALDNVSREIDISDLRIPYSTGAVNEVSSILSEVINGNPDLFYVGSAYSYGRAMRFIDNASNVYIESIKPSYSYDVSQIPIYKTMYQVQMRKLLEWVPDNATDVRKAKAVHDWLVRYCNYNYNAANSAKRSNRSPWNAFGAIVEKYPVCQGYSLGFLAAMNRLGIPCTCVTQFIGSSGHAWNRVKLSGSWYNLDVTWDDNLTSPPFSATPNTMYFLKSDAWFKKNRGKTGFHSSWSPRGVAGTSTRYDSYTTARWTTYKSAAAKTKVTSYKLSSSSLIMNRDSTSRLAVTSIRPSSVKAANARLRAMWHSSDTSIVSVDGFGTLTTGNKTGTATITCQIDNVTRICKVSVRGTSISDSSITVILSQSSLAYNGQTRRPTLNVVRKAGLGRVVLEKGVDYDVTWPTDTINAGTKNVTITGKGAYTGTVCVSYSITPRSISNASIAPAKQCIYSGSPQAPKLKVWLAPYWLEDGRDFRPSYRNNTNAGTATALVTGIGNYSGTASITFTIAKARVPKPVAVQNLVYNGKPQTGVCGGTGYKLKGNTGTNVGTYTTIASLINTTNYMWSDGTSNSKSITWSIAAKPSSASKLGNPVSVKCRALSSTQAALKRGNVVFSKSTAFTVTNAEGAVSYSAYKIDEKAQDRITVSNSGTITLKKGLTAGQYFLTIKIDVAGNSQYESAIRYAPMVITVR